jgi:DNA-directed RNA polymerase subunit alpha|tara:strand:+ start:2270 stop:3400 length:1131 start_codon:yes stop_codon:yes gene_type:complete
MPTVEYLTKHSLSNGKQYGRFSIGQFSYRGQAITFANSLRRTLLGDLRGLAITQLRIEYSVAGTPGIVEEVHYRGNLHEYSNIPGVRESIFEILLNLKEIHFRKTIQKRPFKSEVYQMLANESGLVTTGKLELSENISFVNKDQPILTILNPKLTVLIQFTIEEGQGFRIGQKKVHLDMPAPSPPGSTLRADCLIPFEVLVVNENQGWIPVDCKFLPVISVNYVIHEEKEEIPGFDDLYLDHILFELWTDGSQTPFEALHQAQLIWFRLFSLVWYDNEEELSIVDNSQRVVRNYLDENKPTKLVQEEPTNTSYIRIEELRLSVRAYNCLKRAQINTLEDLLDYSKGNLLEIKNFGVKSADEVKEALQNRFGILLPD